MKNSINLNTAIQMQPYRAKQYLFKREKRSEIKTPNTFTPEHEQLQTNCARNLMLIDMTKVN